MPPLAEVDEALAGVPEADEATVGRDAVLDEALVEARGLVPAEADALPCEMRRQVRFPEVCRLAHMAVGIDDELVRVGHVTRIRSHRGPVNAVLVIGPQG